MENYGYKVIDLGKDVPPETIANCAIENNIRLVGLSALMTTTVPAMEETIKLISKLKPDCTRNFSCPRIFLLKPYSYCHRNTHN